MNGRIDRLERLAGLQTKGALSEDEFNAQKAKLLGGPVSQELRPTTVSPSANNEQLYPDDPSDATSAPLRHLRILAVIGSALVLGGLAYGIFGQGGTEVDSVLNEASVVGGTHRDDQASRELSDSEIRSQFHDCLESSNVTRYRYGSPAEQANVEDALAMCMRSHGITDERFALYVQRGGQVKFDDLLQHCSSQSVIGQVWC